MSNTLQPKENLYSDFLESLFKNVDFTKDTFNPITKELSLHFKFNGDTFVFTTKKSLGDIDFLDSIEFIDFFNKILKNSTDFPSLGNEFSHLQEYINGHYKTNLNFNTALLNILLMDLVSKSNLKKELILPDMEYDLDSFVASLNKNVFSTSLRSVNACFMSNSVERKIRLAFNRIHQDEWTVTTYNDSSPFGENLVCFNNHCNEKWNSFFKSLDSPLYNSLNKSLITSFKNNVIHKFLMESFLEDPLYQMKKTFDSTLSF